MKILRTKFVLSVSVLVLSFAAFIACSKDSNNNNNTSGLSTQDQTFVTNASASNAAEIQFGQLAEQKAVSDSVKTFARMMVTDHTTAQKSLDSIAKSLNVVRSDSMDAAHKTLYAALSKLNTASFDTAYIRSQVQDHKTAQNLLQTEAGSGQNNLLVKYANKNLPIIKKHLDYATRIQNYLRTGSNNEQNP